MNKMALIACKNILSSKNNSILFPLTINVTLKLIITQYHQEVEMSDGDSEKHQNSLVAKEIIISKL